MPVSAQVYLIIVYKKTYAIKCDIYIYIGFYNKSMY